MQKIPALCEVALFCLTVHISLAQSVDSVNGKLLNYPSRLFGKLQSKFSGLNKDLSAQTEKYLDKMSKREQRLERKLLPIDSLGARRLFAGSAAEYTAMIRQLKSDTGKQNQALSGQYQPYADSLQAELRFLQQNPQLLSAGARPQAALSQLQAFQAKMQVANEAKLFIQQRRQQIEQYITQHANLQGMMSPYYSGISRDAYYYSQQVNQYRDMLNDPGRLEQRALGMVSGLPAYQAFMKSNSQLSGLFKLPGSAGGGGSAEPIPGLQTHSQVAQQVQEQATASGDGGMGALQSKLQSAQSAFDGYKNKLSQLGAGSIPADAPNFRPNDQKTKTLWHRLEYGVNFQTTHNNYYYPIVTDLGASLGYKLGHSNVVGFGASYKIGWGSDIQHVAITGQGVGLRSFIQFAIKGGLAATGGFEYNCTTPFTSYQQLKQLQYWTKSGLIGLSKTVSMKSRMFKKTSLSLLWDFLSYQQMPQTQPLLFRIGYTF